MAVSGKQIARYPVVACYRLLHPSSIVYSFSSFFFFLFSFSRSWSLLFIPFSVVLFRIAACLFRFSSLYSPLSNRLDGAPTPRSLELMWESLVPTTRGHSFRSGSMGVVGFYTVFGSWHRVHDVIDKFSASSMAREIDQSTAAVTIGFEVSNDTCIEMKWIQIVLCNILAF